MSTDYKVEIDPPRWYQMMKRYLAELPNEPSPETKRSWEMFPQPAPRRRCRVSSTAEPPRLKIKKFYSRMSLRGKYI